jgi:hypothetical protein
MLKELNLNALQNSDWTVHLEEQDSLAARNYAGNISLYYRGTGQIQRSSPLLLLKKGEGKEEEAAMPGSCCEDGGGQSSQEDS